MGFSGQDPKKVSREQEKMHEGTKNYVEAPTKGGGGKPPL